MKAPSVKCPTCWAKPGEWCRNIGDFNRGRIRRRPHKDRLRAVADELTAEAQALGLYEVSAEVSPVGRTAVQGADERAQRSPEYREARARLIEQPPCIDCATTTGRQRYDDRCAGCADKHEARRRRA